MTARVQVPAPRGGYSGATLHLDIDPTEHQRRQNAGIGTVTGHGFGGLDHLMALPAGLPVPVNTLTKAQQEYVRRAPAGILTVEDGQVTRHAIRPCRVTLATVRSKSATKRSLESASRFAPFCARTVVIERHHPHMNYNLLEFGFYGIGVVLERPDGTTETLITPRPWRPMRHTPAAWWFAENAYAAYLTHIRTDEGATQR
ncbi:hypothetical protein [Streptomyces scopuliridis]|uniref:hypothetical protein n=1 Tax=Streptomyces scopuliridis TaxID=452529 RepID=UPI003417F4DB